MISSQVTESNRNQAKPAKPASDSSIAKQSKPVERANVPRLRPLADAFESESEYRIVMDVPGATPEHVDVTVEGERLRVRAERHERGQLSAVYEQEYALPQSIDRDGVRANLEAGALAIVLPKAPALRPKQVPVSTA